MQVYLSTVVISEPDDVAICEGRSSVFTCVLDSSINSNDVQWYRLLKDTSVTERVNQSSNFHFYISTTNNTLTSTLTVTNATKSHSGYYWVALPSNNMYICNVSLTVRTSTYVYMDIIMQFIL